MPVKLLRDEQAVRYGYYHPDPSPEQLTRFFYLNPAAIQFLAPAPLPYTRLGCGMLRILSTFLPAPMQAPSVDTSWARSLSYGLFRGWLRVHCREGA